MSISYADDISDGSGVFTFLKILCRWKGSLYKLVWIDLLSYLTIYYIIHLVYRFLLNPTQRDLFHMIVDYCDDWRTQLPVSFVLGFFVSGVIGRWFNTFLYIPWMNDITYSVMCAVNSPDPKKSLAVRLTVMRYLNLAWILSMRGTSDRIAARFQHRINAPDRPKKVDYRIRHDRKELILQTPNARSSPSPNLKNNLKNQDPSPNPASIPTKLSKSGDKTMLNVPDTPNYFQFNQEDLFEGFDDVTIQETLRCINNDQKVKQTYGKIITKAEIAAFDEIAMRRFCKTRIIHAPEEWVPLQWAIRLLQKAGVHGNIPDPKVVTGCINKIGKFRAALQNLRVYSNLTMPLVYTQVAVIAVYGYFICQIMGSQYTERIVNGTDKGNGMYIPIFDIFYFIFLMGWLKVALCVMNPFGDDYEDFETSEILDYNLDVSYRAILLDEATFPDSLKFATYTEQKLVGYENDNLKDFLEDVRMDMDQVEFDEDTNDITNLEIHEGCCSKWRSIRKSKVGRFEEPLTDGAMPNPLNY